MTSQSNTSLFLTGALSRFLYDLNREFQISGQVDIEVNGIAFHLSVDGDSAILSFDSFSDALRLHRSFALFTSHANDNKQIYADIKEKLNMTVYLQSRIFGIIGPKANTVLSRILDYSLLLRRQSRKYA